MQLGSIWGAPRAWGAADELGNGCRAVGEQLGNTREAVKKLVTWGALSDGSVFDQGWLYA